MLLSALYTWVFYVKCKYTIIWWERIAGHMLGRCSGCGRDFTCSTLVNHGIIIHMKLNGSPALRRPDFRSSSHCWAKPFSSTSCSGSSSVDVHLRNSANKIMVECERSQSCNNIKRISNCWTLKVRNVEQSDDQMTSVDRWSFKCLLAQLQDSERPFGQRWQWRHSAPFSQPFGFQNLPGGAG